MKPFAIIFLIAALVGMTQSMTLQKSVATYFGTSDDWKNYTGSNSGIKIDVDLSSLNLANTPSVSTYLTCKTKCWTVSGTTNLYNLSNKGFQVYLYKINSNLTVEEAKKNKWVLHYRVDSLDQ